MNSSMTLFDVVRQGSFYVCDNESIPDEVPFCYCPELDVWRTYRRLVAVIGISVAPVVAAASLYLMWVYWRNRTRFPISEQWPRLTMVMCGSAVGFVIERSLNIVHFYGYTIGIVDVCGFAKVKFRHQVDGSNRSYAFTNQRAYLSLSTIFEMGWHTFVFALCFVYISRCLRVFHKHYRTILLMKQAGVSMAQHQPSQVILESAESLDVSSAHITDAKSLKAVKHESTDSMAPATHANTISRISHRMSMRSTTSSISGPSGRPPITLILLNIMGKAGCIIGYLAFWLAGIIPYMMVIGGAEHQVFNETYTSTSIMETVVRGVLVPVVGFGALALIKLTSSIQDNTNITMQLQVLTVWYVVWIIPLAIDSSSKDDDSDATHRFLPAQYTLELLPLSTCIVFSLLLLAHPLCVMNSVAKATKNVRADTDSQLRACLNDSTNRDKFLQYLMKEFAAENLYFWVAVEQFRTDTNAKARKAADDETAGKNALRSTCKVAETIYGSFVSANSASQVNLPSHAVATVHDRIKACRSALDQNDPSLGAESGSTGHAVTVGPESRRGVSTTNVPANLPSTNQAQFRTSPWADLVLSLAHVFDEAQGHVFHLMRTDSFTRFQASAHASV